MFSTPRPAAVLVKNAQSDIIIKRETYEDLVSDDEIPQRLSSKIMIEN